MRLATLTIAIFLACISPVNAQEHLVPERHLFSTQDQYQQKIRLLFEEGFRPEVRAKVLILESFTTESLVGIRKTSHGMEVFHLRARSSIGDTEILKEYEAGRITLLDRNGNQTPGIETKEYQDLKSRTSSDFREIPIESRTMSIDQRTADRVLDVWKTMLLETHYTKKGRFGKDGTTYYFSMWDSVSGPLTGEIWSPSEASRTGRLVHLANSLRRYAHQEISEANLKAIIKTTRLQLNATR